MFRDLWDRFIHYIRGTQVWNSFWRHGYPDNDRDRLLIILANFFLHIFPTKVKKHALRFPFTWGMGMITFYLFLWETITGILLMFYYRPVPEYAYADIKYLHFDVPFGLLLRNTHRWGAHAMVIAVWLHMLRVFLTGSYKPPREFNWVIGVVLLVITLLLSFSGYLLPWDQIAIWAVTVGTNMARATPFLGHEGPFSEFLGVTEYNDIRFALLGGRAVGGNALLRFYVLHCILLPFVLAIFLGVHLWRVRKDGGISGPAPDGKIAHW